MIFRRLKQLSKAKVIKVIQKQIKNHLIFRSFTNQYAINHNISFIVIIYPRKVITTIKKTHYLCSQIIISIFLIFKPDTARANVVFKLMLDKNKKFRVIEEGVMNQGEMGELQGGCFPCSFYGCPDTSPGSYSCKPCNCLVTCTSGDYHVCIKGLDTVWTCPGTYTACTGTYTSSLAQCEG